MGPEDEPDRDIEHPPHEDTLDPLRDEKPPEEDDAPMEMPPRDPERDPREIE